MNLQLGVVASCLVFGAVLLGSSKAQRLSKLGRSSERETFSRVQSTGVELIARARKWMSRKRDRERKRTALIEFFGALSAEIGIGQPLSIAFERAAEGISVDLCPRTRSVIPMSGDVPEALLLDADDGGLPSLRALAALWKVGENSGASLSLAINRLAESQLANEEVRSAMKAELAGPKATVRVLMGLPLLGLVLGGALGGSPIAWLTGSLWGLLVLSTGIGLEILGLVWVNHMVGSVEKRL